MYLWLEKPFWACDVKRFITVLSLLLTALEMILYIQLNKEIGLHFLISFAVPFLGINLMIDPLKLFVNLLFRNVSETYLVSGVRNRNQNLLINPVLIPSIPGEDPLFAPSKARLNSSSVKGSSKEFFSSSLNVKLRTKGWEQMSSPKNSSMHPSRVSGSSAGLLKDCLFSWKSCRPLYLTVENKKSETLRLEFAV